MMPVGSGSFTRRSLALLVALVASSSLIAAGGIAASAPDPASRTATFEAPARPLSAVSEPDPLAQPMPFAVSYLVDPPSGFTPHTADFTSFVAGGTPPYNYTWNFGDNSPAAYGRNVTHTFTDASQCNYCWTSLQVRDSVGTTSNEYQYVVVSDPNVRLSAARDHSAPGGPRDVTLRAAGSGTPPLNFTWSFGGPSPDQYGTVVTNTYPSSGWWYPTVYLRDGLGRTDSWGLQVYVEVPNIQPGFSANPPSGLIPLNVTFNGSAFGGEGPYNYTWDFADGSPAGYGANIVHRYTFTGAFFVRLDVRDQTGTIASANHYVFAGGSMTFLAASIGLDVANGPTPMNVDFRGIVSAGVPPYVHSWSFNDGSPLMFGQNVSHTFTTRGSWTVMYRATDSIGDQVGVQRVVSSYTGQLGVSVLADPPYLQWGNSIHLAAFAGGGSPPFNFTWDFDDGSPRHYGREANHSYARPGYYNPWVTVVDAEGVDMAWVQVEVTSSNLVASAAADLPAGFHSFTASMLGVFSGGSPPYTEEWEFGDGTAALDSNAINHTYPAPGRYSANYRVRDGSGNSWSQQVDVYVVSPANFYVQLNPTSACCNAPLQVNFYSQITGGTGPFTYRWIFGDGGGSVQPSPSHTFAIPGTYLATLVVTDSTGANATSAALVDVRDPNNLEVAIYAAPPSGLAPLPVSFASSVSGGDPPYNVSWEFDDGSPVSYDPTPTHVYTRPRNYYPMLQVIDSSGNQRAINTQVQVTVLPLGISVQVTPPYAPAPHTVQASAVVGGGVPPYLVMWDFGDGSPSASGVNVSHTYNWPGGYSVNARVWDAEGNQMTAYAVVRSIAPPFQATAWVTPPSGSVPHAANFNGSVAGALGPIHERWDFGDGSPFAYGPTAFHTYLSQGNRTASYRVIDQTGQQQTILRSVSSSGGGATLQVTARATPSSGIAPHTTQFASVVAGGTGPYTYTWNFDDGSPNSTAASPSHVYGRGGYYGATLTVRDSTGSSRSVGVVVQLSNPPLALTAWTDDPSGIVPHATVLEAQAGGGVPPYVYRWDTADGAPIQSGQQVTHSFNATGWFYVEAQVTDAAGGTVNTNFYVRVERIPLGVSATVDHPGGSAPHTVRLKAVFAGGIGPYTYWWDPDDGSPRVPVMELVHTYTTPGYYNPWFEVYDSSGSSRSRGVDVEVWTSPVPLTATASVTPPSGLKPLPVQFSAQGIGGMPPYTYIWDFDDGSPGSVQQNPTHVYFQAGGYNPQVDVTDAVGDNVNVDMQVDVEEIPLVADASADPPAGIAPLGVAFNGTVSGGVPPYQYSWDFDDGSPFSTLQHPVHVYNQPGSYSPTFRVTDAEGNTDTSSTDVEARWNSPPLTASARGTPLSGTAPLDVGFMGIAAGGTAPYTYFWDFDDGTNSTLQNPAHTFTTPGNNYNAAVRVTDSTNATSWAYVRVETAGQSLSVTMSASNHSGVAPLTVDFTCTATGGRPGYQYLWDFGDGTTATGMNATHVFPLGIFTVYVSVTDADNNTATTWNRIVVTERILSTTVTVSKSVGTVPLPLTFTSTTTGGKGPYSYLWEFGDGATNTTKDPAHTYAISRSYMVKLRIVDSTGFTTWASVNVTANPRPGPAAQAAPNPSSVGVPVSFAGSATGGTVPLTLSWEFGDGTNASGPLVKHAYAAAGSYNATVTATDSDGASEKATVIVVVGSRPVVTMTATPSAATVGAPVQFAGNATGGTAPYSHFWDFGDGGTASTKDATHTYATAGRHIVRYSAEDFWDGVGTTTEVVVVAAVPSVSAIATPDRAGVGAAVEFTSSVSGGNGPIAFAWNFGDGSTGSGVAPTHPFTAAGNYSVSLMVTEANGVTANGTVVVRVFAAPSVSVTATPTSVEAGTVLKLEALVTTAAGVRYDFTWDTLAEGCVGVNAAVLTCAPTKEGNYPVKVTVTDEFGQKGEASVAVTVKAKTPTADPGLVTGLGFGLLLMLLVVALLAFLLFKARRKEKPAIAVEGDKGDKTEAEAPTEETKEASKDGSPEDEGKRSADKEGAKSSAAAARKVAGPDEIEKDEQESAEHVEKDETA